MPKEYVEIYMNCSNHYCCSDSWDMWS